MMTIEQVMLAISEEMEYQDHKWGVDKQQSLPGYIAIMAKEVREANDGWCANLTGRDSPLHEVLQAVTVGIRCLMRYGVTGSAEATDDRPMTNEEYIGFDEPLDQLERMIKQTLPSNTPRYDKVITLTSPAGHPIHIGKAIFLTAFSALGSAYTTVKTKNGSYEVRESVAAIQAMLQD